MRKQMRKAAAVCLSAILLACLSYLGLALYYSGGFLLNTWINGVYCTGRTVEEVNAELLRQTKLQDEITVAGYETAGEGRTEKTWTISLREADIAADYTEGLKKYLIYQDPWLWVDHIMLHAEHTLQPELSYEKENLRGQWEKIAAAANGDEDYRIEYREAEGYSFYDGLHDHLDEEKAFQVLLDAIIAGKDKVDLVEEGCYYDLEPTEEQQKMYVLWQKIDFFQSRGPVYDFGDGDERLDEAAMAYFIKKDTRAPYLPLLDRGCLQIDGNAVDSYIADLAQQHSTTGKEWAFQSTRGAVIPVKGVNYETVIDREAEREWIEAYLQSLCLGERPAASGAAHIPGYETEAFNRSSTTIGGTYIEVDMGEQKLYYYENGECRLETDVVSGNMRRKMGTPEGVNYVYAKARNRVLRGPGYASPVKFWMPVNGNIGLHDAAWRSEFGGDIYKTDGSHGCVNLPVDVMGELYEMVEIGTPVVMFYGEEE